MHFFEVIIHKCKLIGQTKTDPSLSDPFPCAYYETLLIMSTALASVVRGYVYRMSRRLRMRDIHALVLERVCTCIVVYIYANSLTLAPHCSAFH